MRLEFGKILKAHKVCSVKPTMRILEYNHLDYSRVEEQYEKIITMLQHDDFYSADVKKITGTPYYRVKLDYTNRLLFKIVSYNNQKYALILEVIYNHDYKSSKFLNGAKVDESQVVEVKDFASEITEPIIYINEGIKSFNILDKVISFDDEQYKILRLHLPLIIIGSAGSGKTVLTLEKMKECYGDILYITHSPFLVENSRNLYYANQYANENQNIDFLSYRELLETIKIPEGREINGKTFSGWLVKQNRSRLFIDANKLFEEFKGTLTGSIIDKSYLSRDEYLGLGIKQSIYQPEERTQVYDLFGKYLQFLTDEKIYDSNIVSFEYLGFCQPKYDFIVVDEIQDFTNIQLRFILKMLKDRTQFILSGDSNQIVHPNFFSWSKVKTMFYQEAQDVNAFSATPSDIICILYKNYRNSLAVTQAANNILKLKNLRFGSIDKESNYLVESRSTRNGAITCLGMDNHKVLIELNEKTRKSTKYAVIVLHEDLKQEARKHFQTPLIFSIQEAKGLEYANVILFNFISCEERKYHEITKGVLAEDLTQDLTYARAKDKSDHSLEIYKFYINSLYVAITRAIDNIYVIEERPKHTLVELLGLKNISENISLACEESSLEEWRQEARKLELQGKLEQAEEIKNSIFEQKAVPWQPINQNQLQLLQNKAFDSVKTDKDAMLLLFEYAVIYNQSNLIGRLKTLNFKPAQRIDQAKDIIEKKYYLFYGSNNFSAVVRDTNTYGIDFRNQFNQTPLMIAVGMGNTLLVQHLINNGSNPTLVDSIGRTSLQLALLRAFLDDKYAQKKLAELYPLILLSSVSIKIGDKLIKLDSKLMEFFLFNLMVALTPDRVEHGFGTEDFLKPLDKFPESVLLARRKKRSYLSSILSKNEIGRNDKYNRTLFLRIGHGRYILNPDIEIKVQEDWRPVYVLMNIGKEKLDLNNQKAQNLKNNVAKQSLKQIQDLPGEPERDWFTIQTQIPKFLRIRNKELASTILGKKELSYNEWGICDYGSIIEIGRNFDCWNKMRAESPTLLLTDIIQTISHFASFVYKNGWKNIEIIDGGRLLQFLFWVESQKHGLKVTGYNPNDDELYWYNETIKNQSPPYGDKGVYSSFIDLYEYKVLRSGFNRLRLINSEAIFAKEQSEIRSRTSTGWAVDDYGDALEIREPYIPENRQPNDSIGDQIQAMEQTVKIIIEKRWLGVEIASGPKMLKFLFWTECKKCGVRVVGYNPIEKKVR